MNTRCYRCGWSFAISREAATAALAELKATGGKYHTEHCPRCRQALKISLDQIMRAVPNPDEVTAAPVEAAAPLPAATAARPAAPAPEPPPAPAKPHRKRGIKKVAAPVAKPKAGKPAAKPAAAKKSAAKKPAAKANSSASKKQKGKKP